MTFRFNSRYPGGHYRFFFAPSIASERYRGLSPTAIFLSSIIIPCCLLLVLEDVFGECRYWTFSI
jgi:hypothetical protein